jgi:hypothetical protein
MKKTIRWRTGKLSLSPETVRTLTVPELGQARGGWKETVSYCESLDDNTNVEYTETGCVHRSNGTCMNC